MAWPGCAESNAIRSVPSALVDMMSDGEIQLFVMSKEMDEDGGLELLKSMLNLRIQNCMICWNFKKIINFIIEMKNF